MIRLIKIRKYERGLLFRDHDFRKMLGPGRYWVFDPLFRVRVEKFSVRQIWLESPDLEVVVRDGALPDGAGPAPAACSP